MTTLATATPRTYELGENNDFPAVATDIIYEGSAVGLDSSGNARPLVAGDVFAGFACPSTDNSTGSAGDKYVHVKKRGAVQLAVSGAAATDVGRPVYASDDNTFTFGIGTFVGYVARYVSSGVVIVDFDAARPERVMIVTIPVQLASITGAGDVLTDYTPGFHGRIKKMDFAVSVPVTTGSKAASLNAEIGSTNLTGGVIALTSANCTPLGAKVAGSAVTAANAFTATDTISIEAATVTAFAEGAGYVLLELGY